MRCRSLDESVPSEYLYCFVDRQSVNCVSIPSCRAYQPIRDELYQRFVEAMRGRQTSYSRILNMDQWFILLTTLAGRFLCLRDKLTSHYPIYGKIVFSNARHRTPFIGMESYLRVIQEHGIPVCQDSVTMYPLGDDPGVVPLEDAKDKDSLMRPLMLTLPLALNGLASLGADIPMTDINTLSAELSQALHRGAGVHP